MKKTDKIVEDIAVEDVDVQLDFRLLQILQNDWSMRNFPKNLEVNGILGVVEEIGELCHSYLKILQGIRGTEEEHTTKMKDAVGDITIFLSEVCSAFGFDFQEIIDSTWKEVAARDWTKQKVDSSSAVRRAVRQGSVKERQNLNKRLIQKVVNGK